MEYDPPSPVHSASPAPFDYPSPTPVSLAQALAMASVTPFSSPEQVVADPVEPGTPVPPALLVAALPVNDHEEPPALPVHEHEEPPALPVAPLAPAEDD
eukprot:393707-Amphidinium_carterae.1